MSIEESKVELAAIGDQARRIATSLSPVAERIDRTRSVLSTYTDDAQAVAAHAAATRCRDDVYGAVYGHLRGLEEGAQRLIVALEE